VELTILRPHWKVKESFRVSLEVLTWTDRGQEKKENATKCDVQERPQYLSEVPYRRRQGNKSAA
jgi:hypothetical protein